MEQETPQQDTRPEPATSQLEMAETQVGSVFVSNYPPYSQWSEGDLEAFQTAIQTEPGEDAPPLGMYLHIPFCRKRCRFCYFRVYTDKNADEVQTYCDALAREVEAYAELPITQGRPLRFIYFGGGTPSYISAITSTSTRRTATPARTPRPWAGYLSLLRSC